MVLSTHNSWHTIAYFGSLSWQLSAFQPPASWAADLLSQWTSVRTNERKDERTNKREASEESRKAKPYSGRKKGREMPHQDSLSARVVPPLPKLVGRFRSSSKLTETCWNVTKSGRDSVPLPIWQVPYTTSFPSALAASRPLTAMPSVYQPILSETNSRAPERPLINSCR